MTDVSPLFRPFTLRGMELKNRIVMAPMTRSRSPGAFPNDENWNCNAPFTVQFR
jgi:2,4-dienoyl-CoA reductase-like NADH-dependent reductase (Old Yellow Enzyme family)